MNYKKSRCASGSPPHPIPPPKALTVGTATLIALLERRKWGGPKLMLMLSGALAVTTLFGKRAAFRETARTSLGTAKTNLLAELLRWILPPIPAMTLNALGVVLCKRTHGLTG